MPRNKSDVVSSRSRSGIVPSQGLCVKKQNDDEKCVPCSSQYETEERYGPLEYSQPSNIRSASEPRRRQNKAVEQLMHSSVGDCVEYVPIKANLLHVRPEQRYCSSSHIDLPCTQSNFYFPKRNGRQTQAMCIEQAPRICFDLKIMCKVFGFIMTMLWVCYYTTFNFDEQVYILISRKQYGRARDSSKQLLKSQVSKLKESAKTDMFVKGCIIIMIINVCIWTAKVLGALFGASGIRLSIPNMFKRKTTTPDLIEADVNDCVTTVPRLLPQEVNIRRSKEELNQRSSTVNQGCLQNQLRCENQNAQCGNQNTQCGYQNTQCGNQNTQCGNQNTQCGNQNTQCGNQNTQCGNQNSQSNVPSRNQDVPSQNQNVPFQEKCLNNIQSSNLHWQASNEVILQARQDGVLLPNELIDQVVDIRNRSKANNLLHMPLEEVKASKEDFETNRRKMLDSLESGSEIFARLQR